MNTFKSLIVTVISTIAVIIDISSSGMVNWLDKIVTNIMVSEKLCPRCGNVDEHISKNAILCPNCMMEVNSEECEDCPDESDGNHPHNPMFR